MFAQNGINKCFFQAKSDGSHMTNLLCCFQYAHILNSSFFRRCTKVSQTILWIVFNFIITMNHFRAARKGILSPAISTKHVICLFILKSASGTVLCEQYKYEYECFRKRVDHGGKTSSLQISVISEQDFICLSCSDARLS